MMRRKEKRAVLPVCGGALFFCGTALTGITLIITPFVNCVDTFPLKGQRFLWEF